MAVFKCKMCGGTIEFEPGDSVGICDSCGTRQTLPKLDDDRRANLYDRANHYRRNNEFDKASTIYEQILTEETTDAEAYWSLVLCRYGIEYVEDPASHNRVPTVNRAQFTSVFDDDNYKSAIKYADGYQRELYEQEAKTINEIQKGILAISQKEEPFDVFICYKETDVQGRRTQDSVLAADLYHLLTGEGFKVFFSRITLEDKLGTAYEPYIFAALNSARVMVVLGTKPEYFNAVWVKNEWSRYLALVKKSNGKKVLIPAYRDMDPYDLPEEFSHLQAQDMSKLGFMQDLTRGIKKIAKEEKPATSVKENVVVGAGVNVAPLLKRVFLFLEDEKWQEADEYCEKVLDQDPENAQAYLGKLMAEMHASREVNLKDCAKPFDDSDSCRKAIRFGSKDLEARLDLYNRIIRINNDYDGLTEYDKAESLMEIANGNTIKHDYTSAEENYKAAALLFKRVYEKWKNVHDRMNELTEKELFEILPDYDDFEEALDQAVPDYGLDYSDALDLSEKCLNEAEISRKDGFYFSAKNQMKGDTIGAYKEAIKAFQSISGWKDADEQAAICRRRVEEILAREEARRLEEERKEKERQIKAIAAKRRRKRVITGIFVFACIAVVTTIVMIWVVIPKVKKNQAMELISKGRYDEAYELLEELGEKETIRTNKQERAMELIAVAKYEEAYELLDEIGEYETIKSNKHERALRLIATEKYEEAYDLLEEIGENQAINDNRYDRALAFSLEGEYEEAMAIFEELGSYKDSKYQEKQCVSTMIGAKNIGESFFFGKFVQSESQEKEPIEWLIIDKKKGKTLAVSMYGLSVARYATYNDRYSEFSADPTWEESAIRKYLNDSFFQTAFNDTEKDLINETSMESEYYEYGKINSQTTTDNVFLLDASEAKKYMKLLKPCVPVELYSGEYLGWWLRSSHSFSCFDYVSFDSIVGEKTYMSVLMLRPALWIISNE